MKKLLLTLGACTLAMNAFAAITIDNILPQDACNFDKGELYQYWLDNFPNTTFGWSNYAQEGNEMTFQVVQGGYESEYCAMAENLTDGEQYYYSQISYTFEEPLVEGGEYGLSFWAKCNVASTVQVAYQSNVNWQGGLYKDIELTTEWKQYQIQFTVEKEQVNVLQFNLGKVIGQYYFDDFEFGPLNDDTPTEVPDNADIVATFYKASGFTGVWDQIFNSWSNGNDGTANNNYEEDGYPCFMFTNSTVEASWDGWKFQASLHDVALKAGTEYFVNFKVKGTEPATALTAFVNGENDINTDFTTYNVTSEWSSVTITCIPIADATPNSIILNLANYVGTLYITDVTVYTLSDETGDVKSFETIESGEIVIYNLQGVKQNVKNVSELAKGIYIVNGKKVLVK